MNPYRRTRAAVVEPAATTEPDPGSAARVRGRDGPPTRVYTVMADYPDAWCWSKAFDAPGPGVGGLVGCARRWDGRHPLSKGLIDGLSKWQTWWAEGLPSHASTADNYALFPWRVFHQEGWALCQRLKQEIGDAAHVLYSKPCEDPWYFENEYAEFAIDGSFTFLPGQKPSSADAQGSIR